ncbi:MAG: M23 family metallopeptidase [Actinobacteria bacterium]|nr:MAG: M23 family metallopeptidase [Actinomycetota bacterium]
MKKLFLLAALLLIVFPSVSHAQLRFNQWPLDNWDKREVLKQFDNTHYGVDISAEEQETVVAPLAGKIYWTYSGGSHGIAVGIEHDGLWRTTYLHMSERLVKKGEQVVAGQPIGKVGVTGGGRDSQPSHLHFALITNPLATIEDPMQRYGNPLDFGPIQVESQPIENNYLTEKQILSGKAIFNPEPAQTPITSELPLTLQPVALSNFAAGAAFEKMLFHAKAKKAQSSTTSSLNLVRPLIANKITVPSIKIAFNRISLAVPSVKPKTKANTRISQSTTGLKTNKIDLIVLSLGLLALLSLAASVGKISSGFKNLAFE